MSVFASFLLSWALLSGSAGLQWSSTPTNGQVLYACVGDDVTIPWSFTVGPAEEIASTEWIFDGSSQEMVAMSSHGAFLPMPALSGRVQQLGNGGLVLSHVTAGDAGNYTVEVNVRDGGTLKRTVMLQVAMGLQTTDGRLHVTLNNVAFLDSTTHKWSLALSCGQFTYIAQPAFPVEWVTPSGQVLASSVYKNGYFDLHLASPVEGGSYSCRVPQQHTATACLHGNHSSAAQATIVVDGMIARLTLTEAQLGALLQDNTKLRQQVSDLGNILTNIDARLTQEINSSASTLTQKVSDLGNILTNVDARLNSTASNLNNLQAIHTHDNATLSRMIQDVAIPTIAFNARSTQNQNLNAQPHVQFNQLLYSRGQGFDSSTGQFTAPVSGVYYFGFQTRAYEDNMHSESYIKANGQEICTMWNSIHYDHSSCNAVVHLQKGDRVWVEVAYSPEQYNAYTTSFLGFLITDDPQ